MKTRVRFAPSPTGPLHIGGLRTALFNYLFARKEEGIFILRVEDTDQSRYVTGSENYIQETLEWCGMIPDEGPKSGGNYGPYRQSERKAIYKEYIEKLIERGGAYYAFDSNEELAQSRATIEKDKQTFKYSAKNRMSFKNSLSLTEEETKLALKGDYVIRLKVESGNMVSVHDEIRGTVRVNTDELDDKILMKSDGMPTYHFANVVDDYLMKISCVIRGEEWLPSLPLHKLIYTAFGWETPKFMHLPLILKPSGKGKLSKRDGDKDGFPVFPLSWGEDTPGFREMGFMPEAMINYLALLGWNDGTEQEIFSLEELVQKFDLNRIHKAGAKFDPEKNKWFNHQYLQKQSDVSIAESFKVILDKKGISTALDLTKVVSLIKERANFVTEFWDLADYFFEAPSTYDEKAAKNWKEETPGLMQQVISELEKIEGFTSANIETLLKEWMTTNEIGMGKIMQPLRLSLVGALKGPHLFDIIEMIGKAETVKRIEKAIASL